MTAFLNGRAAAELCHGEALEALVAVQHAQELGHLISVRAEFDASGAPHLYGEGVYSLTPEAAENYRQTGGVWAYVEPAEWLAQWDAAHMPIHQEATA